MKPYNMSNQSSPQPRRGSTLIIVIALLGLLSFVGMVFFSFATSERSAAEYFSDAKKGVVDEPDNVWDHLLRHVIVGPSDRPMDRLSILRSPNRSHSMLHNMVGGDMSPFSGEGIQVRYNSSGLPEVIGPSGNDWLDFVDSPVARGGNENRSIRRPSMDVDYTYPDINNIFLAYRGWAIRDMAEDLNGNGTLDPGEDRNGNSILDTPSPRFERVPVIIPSFMRPQYMKSSQTNGVGSSDTPTDLYWAYASNTPGTYTDVITPGNRATNVLSTYKGRSFRPNPNHISGFRPDGTPVYRYLTDAENSALASPLLSGPFPFVPENAPIGKAGNLNPVRGEMGIWTGSEPEAYELDADNDGDGIKEGIWLDTNFPVQEHVDSSGTSRLYTVLHSVTIYDLDALIDINVHGNLAGLNRSGNIKALALSGEFDENFLSRSNLGLGPNEVNPLPALRANVANLLSSLPAHAALDYAREQMNHGFGINPMAYTNPNTGLPMSSVTQANMEFIWLLTGRADVSGGSRPAFTSNKLDDLFPGRWGESERLFNAVKIGGTFLVADLPRPGKPGDAQTSGTTGIRYGGNLSSAGRDGFDDNQDRYDSEIQKSLGRVRPHGTPMDYAGTGRTGNSSIDTYDVSTGRFAFNTGSDLRQPVLHRDSATVGPERFIRFPGYSFVRDYSSTPARYIYGQNGVYDNGTGDDLIANPQYDPLFEDPLESIFDPDFADSRFDQIYGPGDLFALHMTAADISSAPEQPSERLTQLAPYAFRTGNAPFQFNEQVIPGVRGRFTTVSNSLHRFLMRSPFGADGKPGDAGVDDDMDGTTDEPDEVLYESSPGVRGYKDQDGLSRWWEFSADADGQDANGDGFPDGDGNYEFPPRFFADANANGYYDAGDTAVQPYSEADPFRPQVRRLLTMESGEGRGLFGQMPLSPNHLLDVERNAQTPAEGTKEFLRYMQRAGMRFRPLTDHPLESETAGVTSIPSYSSSTPVNFPPQTIEEREFWARRDRQKLARDIYVMLYTTGGAAIDNNGTDNDSSDDKFVLNYTVMNDFAGTPRYTPDQLRRMAQFAVNLVDAMDSDNVITKFEYDKNLGNGWNLDDDPYSTAAEPSPTVADPVAPFTDSTGLYPEETLSRGVVYGIEAQELAFSETLAVRSQIFNSMYSDSTQMAHNETTDEINFLHIELQNLRPTEVAMAGANTGTTNEELAVWQLARFDRSGTAADAEPATVTQSLSLMAGNNPVDGGKRFTIAIASKEGDPGNTDPTQWATADIYADNDKDNDFELVSPDVTASSVNLGDTVTPHADLDLIHTSHLARWRGAGNSQQPGLFCNNLQTYNGNDNFGYTAAASQDGFDLVLRRRLNPAMPELPLADNPWIEVDRTRVVFENLYREENNAMTMMDEMVLRLDQAPSYERMESIASTTTNPYSSMSDSAPQTWRFNTIGSDLNSTSSIFNYQQVHFDREFSSSIEFLNLPVIGPRFLTHRFERMRQSPYRQVLDGSSIPQPSLITSAEAMFLMPDFPDTSGGTSFETPRDNRWYRLMRFVEVPSRVHKMLGNYLTQQKFPGKININTLRHREVLAGLIDNPAFADVPNLLDSNTNSLEDGPFLVSRDYLDDSNSSNGRDVWQDFMRDRDGRPVKSFQTGIGAMNFLIPGTPNARPFRENGFVGSKPESDDGLDRTLLRRLAGRIENSKTDGVDDDGGGNDTDDDPTNNRHWLEVATDVSHHNQPHASTNTQVRHQILSKIMNNTTTVSNTYIVFGTAAYFEVVEDPATGMIQIGGRYDLNEDNDGDPATNPSEKKSIFVIDRTDAFQSYDPGTGDFAWQQLVKASVMVK